MKKIVSLLIVLTVTVGIAFASGGQESSAKPKKSEKDWKIALVPKDSTNAWFVRMEVGVKQFAKDTGLNAFQKGPAKTDAAMQVQVIQDLIAQGVDALAVVPVDPAALEPVLGEAMKKGIVVVTHEASTQQNTMYDLEAFTNASFGQTIMESLATAMGHKGLYTTMVGNVTNASHNEWADAGVAYATAKYPEMKLLDAEPRVEIMDNLDTAYDRAKELFKKYPDLRGIMGTSSLSAPGVSRAIEELGLQGRAFVSSAGLPNENKSFLKDGTLQSVVLWDPKDAGYALCALAAKVLRGEKIGNGLDLGLKGYENLQFAPGSSKVLVGAGWITINKDNVDSFGF